MDSKTAAAPVETRTNRKIREGVVISDKMDKTRAVSVSWSSMHPRYKKVMHHSSKFYAHDEKNESHAGDLVEIVETRPLSKLKRWRVTRIVRKAV